MWAASSLSCSLDYIKREGKLSSRLPLCLPDSKGNVTCCLKCLLPCPSLRWATPSACELERIQSWLYWFEWVFYCHSKRSDQHKIYVEGNKCIRSQIVCIPALPLTWVLVGIFLVSSRVSHHIVSPSRPSLIPASNLDESSRQSCWLEVSSM